MALLLLASIAVSMLHWGGNAQPSPGYYPSNRFKPLPGFYHGYSNLWGAPHQIVSGDQSSVTLWLDRSSGSGFKSNRPYRSGYFAASIKLQAGYTAGVITAFYLSNDQAHPGSHDEVDIEFMGNTPGKPYRLQTNVYIRDRRPEYVGGEMKFRWFKPVDFHNYTIPMEPFYVDDIPIRRYPRKSADIFPMRPMWMYGTIWDASAWATDRGKYRVDYRYQPFVSRFTKFIIRGCSAFAPPNCRVAQSSPMGSGLSPQQYAAMRWVQNNYMVYNYCTDPGRDHSRTPECY
ncbi:probable xyloglucan endotransglucosylase/hydrolase protein 32 [Zingiber officinale]|uniref:probable xyloglucan endotransglucosylase/hydrolase protein 32 n=1 Tax=Zingiber officinale TaxID=94328 RepID=UPI001C4A99F0|nr:probable xyloglucan endotransglucosylase/hydrolase protein 32 [Zingiber officinale]